MTKTREEHEEEETRTLLVVREVAVYKIPARSTSGGYKCGEWLQSDKIWSGRLRLVSGGAKCQIRLEDSNTGELFATCPVEAGKREATVESVLDSSRYFVLRVDDGKGRHAFIGLGFNERNDAFDFNVALSDHEKYFRRDDQQPSSASLHQQSLDLRLKEGETMKINVKTRGAGTGMMKTAATAGAGRMPPPPGDVRIRSPLPPPPNDIKAHSSQSSPSSHDLSQLQGSLPSTTKHSSNSNRGGAGWAAF